MSNPMREKRTISAHNLPMAPGAPMPRPARTRERADAAFLAQLLATRAPFAPQGTVQNARDGEANSAYRRAEASDIKRLPLGYRKALSA